MLSFKSYIAESADIIVSAIKEKYKKFKIKDISSKRINLYVPSKSRMDIAIKIANNFEGTLAKEGSSAGKPVVDLAFGVRIFVKPIPGSGIGGTAKEDAQLKSLQDQIEKALSEDDLLDIPIKIGKNIYRVAGAASTPGTPKSDFHLLDSNGKEVVWISHKDGSTPKDFQQWSGMSERKEKEIYDHRETQKFIKDVASMTGSVMPRATTLSRPIQDKRLMNLAVYGNEFGRGFSRQNVTLLLQGPVNLVKNKGFYELTSNHTSINGDPMKGGYEPVFMSIYKGDRSNFGIQGARFAIQPKQSRKSKEI